VSAPSGNTWHGLSWPGLELNRFYLEILGSRRVTRNRELLKLLPYIASRGVSPLGTVLLQEGFASPEFGGLPDRHESTEGGRGFDTGSDCPLVCAAVSVFLNPAPRVAL
jgi:hypothetical protein